MESFVDVIKHETRYHLGRVGTTAVAGPLEVEPQQMLNVLGERLRPYVRRLHAGTSVYRVRERTRKEQWEPSGKELGSTATGESAQWAHESSWHPLPLYGLR